MKSFLTPVILLVSILPFVQLGLCFGYVCVGCTTCKLARNGRNFRLMAEPPTLPSRPSGRELTSEDSEVVHTRPSSRRRISSLFRRLDFRVFSFFNRTTPVQEDETEETPLNITDVLELEEVKGQMIAPSSTEIINTRQSKAAVSVNLSGSWKPIVTEDFKKEYDSYLTNCGESLMFRKVVVNGIRYQKETILQLNEGVGLEIIATNPVGNWNRTLVASNDSQPLNVTITDPDGDRVQVEAWWEQSGTKHKSILRGKPRVQGGVFETVRYLENNETLVCESSFHPSPESPMKFKYGRVVWRFQRNQ